MKKTSIILATMLAATPVMADEGMWTLYDLPKAAFEQMQSEGFTMPYADLYQSDNAIKNCVVNFSGYCSGVVVSPDGLVFTNHHCGFEAIRSHSTVEHDYMLNGFYAKSFEEELPNENMFVSFMVEQKDVTDYLDKKGINKILPSQQRHFLDSIENVMSKEVKAKDSTLRLEIKPFFEGNKYYATTYRDFTDLRLVFTIPKSMGKFGGETDNWMWPRQTCDYSVFRIYADPKTNGPAKYSKDNVPYKPKHWAPVSLKGYKDGDFAMTIGFPGSTSRYISSFGIRERRDARNAPMAQVRGVKQDVMIRHMRANEAVRIKYDTKFAQSSNYWKNSLGMNKCIDSTGLIRQKAEFEKRIRQYQDTTGFLKGKLDFAKMEQMYDKRLEYAKAAMYFRETFIRTNELASRALKYHNGMQVEGPAGKPKKQYVVFKDNSNEWDEALDKEVYAVLLKNYREHVSADFLPDFYKTIDEKFAGDCAAYVNYVWDKSLLMKSGTKLFINKGAVKKDLGIAMGLDITEMMSKLAVPMQDLNDSIAIQERYLCAAKIRMEEDLPHYSDANFTMRLSYGQVGGYDLGGTPSGYYTTAESIVEKMKKSDSVIEYYAEPIMHELMGAADFGKYTDETTGKLQLCFLTNNDITGGNSGSPMFNGKGELIGLAFDGNWDSLSSDIFFDKKLARCIGVDIRYVLYLMDKWGHADRLIKEIGAK
ncbi:S46 family peptidase [Prevotella sp. P2-180]|uniref:S46 family peptidase n=1 Tax=Prevotella sp. P2-180 TaxID=2024224 RepID=UPI000B96604C|nr:S46 family peptidase [Prevotella sp. P2-180]MDD5784282.1 S46 family peptidase [Prevotella sp.]MDY4500084.1 S46 family peptidase [Prevotella sp.]OYP67754.1 peptidase S10 [Prevotella sp. P2-180]